MRLVEDDWQNPHRGCSQFPHSFWSSYDFILFIIKVKKNRAP